MTYSSITLPQQRLGIIDDLPNDDYHRGPGVSSSELKTVLKSPAHYKYASENPRPQTPQMALGTAAHALILEPDKTPVVCEPEVNKRTNAGKAELAAFHEEHAGKIICSKEQYDHAIGMRDSVLMHPSASVLFAAGKAEQSHFWLDEITGELCKKRDDWYNTDHEVIVDLKTTSDASREAFLRAVVNFRYDLQEAYYREGSRQTDTPVQEFIFVVVENTPPYAVAIYTLPEELKHKGDIMWRRALDTLHECKITDTWPGYPTEIQVLDCPKWALNV